MKARVIKSGEIINVSKISESLYHDINTSGIDEKIYNESELDFNINKIPNYLEYLGVRYKFVNNKGNILCYSFDDPIKSGTMDEGTIIVEMRDNKRWIDRFYVLFYISAYSSYDHGITAPFNLKGFSRQAKPIFD